MLADDPTAWPADFGFARLDLPSIAVQHHSTLLTRLKGVLYKLIETGGRLVESYIPLRNHIYLYTFHSTWSVRAAHY